MNASVKPIDVRWRPVAWAGIAGLFVVRALLGLPRLTNQAETTIADITTYLIPMLLAGVLMLWLSIRTRDLAERRIWAPLASATGLVLISEVYWTWYSYFVDPAGPQVGLLNHLLPLAALGCFLASIVGMTPREGTTRVQTVRTHLLVLSLGAAVFSSVYLFWTYPQMFVAAGMTNTSAVIIALYPVGGLVVILGTTRVFVARKAYAWRAWERLMVAGLGTYSIGLIGVAAWYPGWASSDHTGTTWYTTLLGAGYWLLVIAAVYRLSSTDEIDHTWPTSSPAGRWGDGEHLITISAGVLVVGWLALFRADQVSSMPLLATTILLATAFVGQSWVSAVSRSHYLKQSNIDRLLWPEAPGQFQLALSSCIEASTAAGVSLSLVVVSLSTSDHGTETGTPADPSPVQRMSEAIHSIFASQQVFRIGELEYAAVCSTCSEDEAAALARRVWLHLIRCSEGDSMPLEVFAGVASINSEIRTVEDLTSAARAACEHARRSDAEPVTVHRSLLENETMNQPDGLGTRAFRSTIRALAHAVDSRHPNTESHSENVSELAVALARVIDLSDEEIHIVGLAALMHDIGKIGVRDSVLFATSALSDVELEEHRDHVELGATILAAAGVDDVVPAVRHHHERWDGTGYPEGLSARQIPLGARLIAICDAFVVLTSRQPHGTVLESAEALRTLESEAGAGFDPELTAAFVRLIRGLTKSGVN